MPTLSDIGRRFDPLREFIQQASQDLENFGQRLDSTRQQVTRNTQQINAVIETLEQGMSQLAQEVGRCADNMSRFSSASAQGRRATEQEAQKVEDLYTIYKRLGIELTELESAKEALAKSSKEMAKVEQLNNEYLRAQEGSYDRLSAKYRIIKILYDNLSEAQLKANPEIATSLREIYEQMNLLQQATGKYQLQVGNYSKAMTGLNIATNQVVRELPVLANGVSMFAIAISNNIPILVDNIVAVNNSNKAQKALKQSYLETAAAAEAAGRIEEAAAARANAAAVETTSVLAALGKAVFSWQTGIVLLLTVLPGLIRNIEKKKKAQEEEAKAQKEANEQTQIAIDRLKSLELIYQDIYTSIEGNVTEMKVLDKILNDGNRSWEDRVDAGRRLKQIFDDELEGFSAEEIAMGKATTLMRSLTEEIYNQAKARAQLNKVTELTQRIIELQDQEQLYGNWMIGTKTVREYAEEVERANKEGRRVRIGAVESEYVEKYRSILSEMNGYQAEINKLIDEISPKDLLKEVLQGGGAVKDKGFNIPNYLNDALEALIEGMSDGLAKRLAQLDLAWKKESETYAQHEQELLKIQKEGNAEERKEATEQLMNLHALVMAATNNYINARKRLVQETLDSYTEEVAQEEDLDETATKALQQRLYREQTIRDNAAYERYEQGVKAGEDEVALKNELNQTLLDSEEKYWRDYLEGLREAGLLTIQEYNKIMAKLARGGSTESGLSRGRRGRRYGGVVEAVLAQTSKYGEGNKFGQGILKEEYSNFVTAVDSALKDSMKLMDEWMAKRLEMAQIAVQAAEKEVDAARTSLNYELEARNEGYANSVETARKELDLARANHKKALDEQKRLEQAQLAIDTAQQVSSLVTATANIWASMTKNTGLLGPILAAAATATMWGAFAAAKVKASQVAQLKSEQYGEGTVELLEGGSHASGHDIDLGTKKDGTRRRAEGGEYFAIINKRNSKKYGSLIPDVINAFNDGTFGEKYQRANAAMGNFALGLLTGGSPTDVSTLEREVRMIREQGEENRYTDSRGNVVIRYKNLTRKYKI